MQYELKTRQVCLFFIAFMPLTKLFLMPSIMANFANEDAWLCAFFNLAIDFFTLLFVVRACKLAQTNFYGLLENALGKTGAKILLAFYLVYFSLKAIIPLTEQKDYVDLTLYTLSPTSIYFLPFFITAFYFCTKNLRVIGRASDILWFVTLIAFLILFSLSISNMDLGAILPVGANGFKNIANGAYSSLTWFGDAVYALFFIGEFKFSKKDGLKIFISYLISAVILIAFMIIFYSIFTSISYRQRFALTEISKYTTVINNIGRFDYVGIMMLLFSNLFSLSMPLFFASKILNYICGFSKKWISPLIIVGIQLLISVSLYQFVYGMEMFIMEYCGVIFLIFGNVIPIVLSFLPKKEAIYESTQG